MASLPHTVVSEYIGIFSALSSYIHTLHKWQTLASYRSKAMDIATRACACTMLLVSRIINLVYVKNCFMSFWCILTPGSYMTDCIICNACEFNWSRYHKCLIHDKIPLVQRFICWTGQPIVPSKAYPKLCITFHLSPRTGPFRRKVFDVNGTTYLIFTISARNDVTCFKTYCQAFYWIKEM